jgi:hypothetical protein
MLDISYPNCCLFHNVTYAESRVCIGRLTVVMPSVIILSVVASFANHDCSSAFCRDTTRANGTRIFFNSSGSLHNTSEAVFLVICDLSMNEL